MSRRRRGLLRLLLAVVLLGGGATAGIVLASGGSNRPRTIGRATVISLTAPGPRTVARGRTQPPAPRPPPLVVPAAVRKLAESLPLGRQVAQLFLLGFTGTTPSAPFFVSLRDRGWGGAVLTRDNYVSLTQLTALAGEAGVVAKNAGQVAPLVAAPQIGGVHTAFPDLPPAAEPQLGATGQPDAAGKAALAAGKALRAADVNMVLAPDAAVGGPSSPIADRTFSADPAQVAAFIGATIDGYAQARVIAAVGSFPGDGGASADPNVSQATVGGSLAELRARDLVPFAAVAGRAPAIQVSNALYAAFDGVTPAVLLPRAIETLLRAELRFGGVVVSGDLGATVQATGGQIGPTAVQALHAGCDLLYIQGNSVDQETAYRAVLAAAQSGKLSRARLLASVERVLALKAKYGVR